MATIVYINSREGISKSAMEAELVESALGVSFVKGTAKAQSAIAPQGGAFCYKSTPCGRSRGRPKTCTQGRL